ncbi:transposase [uncultured Ruegeria sp.]|uniref:transposase n=1 Tax=uncultured Ruegeria sp. TaxID=259304 RepID=UPI003420959B
MSSTNLKPASVQTCMTLKTPLGMPHRQTAGFVQGLLRLVGVDWAALDFSIICKCQQARKVSLPYAASA